VIVLVVASTCLRSIYTVELAAIGVAVCNAICPAAGPIPIVNVPAVDVVLVTAILLTTVVVEAGTVYNTVVVVSDAAVLDKTFVVVAIIYSLS
jgi:hypothetical protein